MELDGCSPVVVISADQALAAVAIAAVQEAGIQPFMATSLDQLEPYGSVPRLVIYGADIDAEAIKGLGQHWPAQFLLAAMGENPDAAPPIGTMTMQPERHQAIVLPHQIATVIQVVEKTIAKRTDSTRIMVAGAHGGAGTSSLAAVLARRLAGAGRNTRLVEVSAAGAPLGAMLGLDSVGDWHNALAKRDVIWPAMPTWCGVQVLSGLAAVEAQPAHRIREIIDLWESRGPDGVTVIDAAPGGGPDAWRVASWSDQVVVVARDCPAGMAAAVTMVDQVLPVTSAVTLALRLVRGGAGVAGARRLTGASSVLALRDERTLPADSTHGLTPGDRPRGSLSRFAATYLNQYLGLDLPVPAQSRPNRRLRRIALPQFDRAAFGEDW